MAQSICEIMLIYKLLMKVGIKIQSQQNFSVTTKLLFILYLILYFMNELSTLR